MKIEPEELSHVTLDTFDPCPCTPVVADPDWTGIEIRAATRVRYQADERLVVPVCGYAMLAPPPEPVAEPMMLHAETAGAIVYTGAIVPLDDSLVLPPPDFGPIDPSELEGVTVGSFFNCDLAAICELPQLTGPIRVWVEFRGHTSNQTVVEVEAVESSA